MRTIKRFLQLIILLPIGVVLVSLAVANRHEVKLALDPFSPEQPVLDFSVPLYVIIFGALLIGVFIGGFMAWVKQGRHRRAARQHKSEAKKWRSEADRQQQRVEKLTTEDKPVAIGRQELTALPMAPDKKQSSVAF
ncbi:LapA family protein [uncultured Cohaesibacter sp.]|uniref:LapA family protein n=1 Tax=uncultured Cohaesibacter sp. TaxID=1002546 RepID=UPI002930BEAF|nr:LapA family protein [uncultured Cohaesibacter sp.]